MITLSVPEKESVIETPDSVNASPPLRVKDAPVCLAQTNAVDTVPANTMTKSTVATMAGMVTKSRCVPATLDMRAMTAVFVNAEPEMIPLPRIKSINKSPSLVLASHLETALPSGSPTGEVKHGIPGLYLMTPPLLP